MTMIQGTYYFSVNRTKLGNLHLVNSHLVKVLVLMLCIFWQNNDSYLSVSASFFCDRRKTVHLAFSRPPCCILYPMFFPEYLPKVKFHLNAYRIGFFCIRIWPVCPNACVHCKCSFDFHKFLLLHCNF